MRVDETALGTSPSRLRSGRMAIYFIRAIGSDFDVADEGIEYADAAEANRTAIRAAIELAADQISGGRGSAIIEARVESGSETTARYVIALSVEPLQVA